MKKNRRPSLFHRLIKFTVRLACLLLWDFRCKGYGSVPASGGLLVVSNHQSFLDLALIGSSFPGSLVYVARQDLRANLIYRLLTWPFDVLPLRRGAADFEAVKQVIERLRSGAAVLLFPEGTRTRTGALGPIRSGFLLIARRAGVPIVPIRLDGAFRVWPRGTIFPGRGRVRLEATPPIGAAGPEEAVMETIRRRLGGKPRGAV